MTRAMTGELLNACTLSERCLCYGELHKSDANVVMTWLKAAGTGPALSTFSLQ